MKKSAPAWSLQGRVKPKNFQSKPGPGAYSPSSYNLQTSPHYGISKAPLTSLQTKETIPGPGQYQPKTSQTLLTSSRPMQSLSSFGSSVRQQSQAPTDIPGPGHYQPKRQLQGPNFSMQGRSQTDYSNYNPGPGQYTPQVKEHVPLYRIGRAKRHPLERNSITPGPGSYSNPTALGELPSWGFGSDKRKPLVSSESPGPASYEIPSPRDTRGYSLVSRKSQLEGKLKESPGPGAYNSVSGFSKIGFSQGKSVRTKLGQIGDSPGPGQYNPSPIKSRATNSIGNSKRVLINASSITPGPGAYKPSSKFQNISYSFRMKYRNARNSETPGPGTYSGENKTLIKSPTWAMGNETRIKESSTDKSRKTIPGPGQYNIDKVKQGPKWGFGTSKRGVRKQEESPGPASYKALETVGNLPSYYRN